MRVSLLQENLARALSRTSRILSARPGLPVLQNVLLSTEEGRLTVATTNLETTEIARVGARVEKEGGLCVPARLLSDLVLSLPPETVMLAAESGALMISCLGTRASIPGVDAKEFPVIKNKKINRGIVFEKTALLSALRGVLFSAATDEGRPLLAGVKMLGKSDSLTVAATDGYRLSVRRMDTSLAEDIDMVIPSRALGEALKIVQEEKDVKEVLFSKTEEGQLSISIADTEILTRLIDGEYPNYQKIIPAKSATQARLSVSSMTRAVKSVSLFARDNANIIKIRIEKNSIIVSANTPSVGENTVEIEAQVGGGGGEMAFNSRFVAEFLANTQEEEVVFEMTGALNPGVFRPTKDESYLHIIMPVRVQS